MHRICTASFTIYYREQGSGLPLVLIHGFPLDHRMWKGQLAGLSSVCRVITPDLPAFGQSTRSGPFTIDGLADDLLEFLRQVGAVPCVLGGLSMGGYVAMAFAARHAEALRALILADTRAEPDSPEARENRLKTIQTLRTSGAGAIADQMLPRLLWSGTLERRLDLVAELRDMIENCPVQAIEWGCLAMRDRSGYVDLLPRIRVPAMAMVGQYDITSSPASMEALARRIPNCRFVVVPDAGHMAPMEQPDAANAAIREFLGSLAAPAASAS